MHHHTARVAALVLAAALAAAGCSHPAREAPRAIPSVLPSPDALPEVVPDQQEPPAGSTIPCYGDEYGALVLHGPLGVALSTGTADQAAAAVSAGEKARGAAIGCPVPEADGPALAWQRGISSRAPSAATVRTAWHFEYANVLGRFGAAAPLKDFDTWGPLALAGYQAAAAGQDVDRGRLRAVVDAALAHQYGPATSRSAAGGSGLQPGVWGAADDPLCDDRPQLCVRYDAGPLAGHTVRVADTDPPTFLRGDLAADNAVFGALLVAAARATGDARLRAAALLAGSWSAHEVAVPNTASVAADVDLLAALYSLTGDDADRTVMLAKLDRAVLPSVLLDADGDGRVDGASAQPFRALSAVAQVPGRLWDGRSARPQNQGAVAAALVDAYAALRDRGRAADARRLRPYVVAMLDNVSHEVLDVGVPTHYAGPLGSALALGLWRIATAEKQAQPRWAAGMATLWNSERGRGATSTVAYLRYLDGDTYRPASG